MSLIDEGGRALTMADLSAGKATLLVPGYFGCPMLCGQVQSGLLDSLKTVSFRDYRVICLSIDARERPGLARQKRQAALSRGADWRFVTGTPENIGQLCQAVGFQFRYDRGSDQFAHPAGIVALTADGRVSSYLFGISFSGPALQRALQRAAANQVEGKIDPVLYLCFQYDPASGRYSLQIWRTLQLLGLATCLSLLSLILYWLQQERKS
ncbi:MAG: SCO family protein [Candidatus Eremiobacteraeota bacterium]|nr:SCO family protein [Candidatus Eremiobacteraeota bacterium]